MSLIMLGHVSKILVILIVTSCTSLVELSPRRCQVVGQLSSLYAKESQFDFEFSSQLTGFGVHSIFFWKDLLEENKIKCENVRNLSFQIQTSGSDFFLSLFPFFLRRTLSVRGSLSKVSKIK